MKHLFTALLLLCATAATAHDFEVDGIYYKVSSSANKTIEVTYKGNFQNSAQYTGSVVIPESVTYNGTTYSVTSIGNEAFYGCNGLSNIVIPNSVTSIGNGAFNGCTGLTSIVIPNSVTSIGNDAFAYCSGLTSITIPNSVTSIGNGAFYYCSGLTSVVIGNSVTSIGDDAFKHCYGLEEVHISDISAWCNIGFHDYCANPLYYAENFYLNGKLVTDLTIPNSVTSIGNYAFSGCTGLTSIVIPNSVTSIGNYAFNNCTGLKEVHISDIAAWCGIVFVSGESFFNPYANPLYYAKNLYLNGELVTELVIPNNVTKIKNYAFYGCAGLTSIEIPNSVTSIGNDAFHNTTWYNNQPDGVVYAGKVLYEYKGTMPSNTSITIKDETLGIADRAFYNCDSLTSIRIPSSVTSIGNEAFYGCNGLSNIVIPNSVTSIAYRAFYRCYGLKTVYNLSNQTFSIGSEGYGYIARYADKVYNSPNALIENAFIENDFVLGKVNGVNTLVAYLGNAIEITLPADYDGENYVIGADVFNGNTTITSIEITKGVAGIESSAFNACNGLEKVCINDIAAWCGIDFGSADANPLHYAKNLYLNGELLTSLTIPAEVAEVKDYAFYNCNGVTNIDIVDGVKSIGNNAFYGCNDLETLYISNTIESIDDYAFAECNNLMEIKIGSKKAITASENVFSSDAYNNACLYVPEGRKFAYEKTAPWSNFYIVEMDFTGIEELKSENGKVKTIYDLNGRRAVENPAKGIYILNGKKVIVK